jgi:hypothetical protein
MIKKSWVDQFFFLKAAVVTSSAAYSACAFTNLVYSSFVIRFVLYGISQGIHKNVTTYYVRVKVQTQFDWPVISTQTYVVNK